MGHKDMINKDNVRPNRDDSGHVFDQPPIGGCLYKNRLNLFLPFANLSLNVI
jgi:hypothetical protein